MDTRIVAYMFRLTKLARNRLAGTWSPWLCALVLYSCIPQSFADEGLEWRVKAAFLVNFARFTEWPTEKFAASDSPLRFCVHDNPEMLDALTQSLSGKSINGRKLEVLELQKFEQASGCHIGFMDGENRKLGQALKTVAGSSMLSVYDANERIEGGAIRLYFDDRKVRFEIDLSVAEQERLKLSSKLLNVARVVSR